MDPIALNKSCEVVIAISFGAPVEPEVQRANEPPQVPLCYGLSLRSAVIKPQTFAPASNERSRRHRPTKFLLQTPRPFSQLLRESAHLRAAQRRRPTIRWHVSPQSIRGYNHPQSHRIARADSTLLQMTRQRLNFIEQLSIRQKSR